MVAYALIGIAVVAEVFGDSMMKLSNGFQRKLPLVGTVLGYGIAFYLIALTLEHLPLGPVYAAWTGLGIALTAIVGAVVWTCRNWLCLAMTLTICLCFKIVE